ncbi:Uncharacterized conserved protein (DUF2088) [Sphaerochaeta pleomorpha str. Grapes]|uniref:Uncharacterized conserved protein (DUF2088) n=1 Tax=Sphaerochaeta pleomorpha (strain ATCC BAA-1885 / DSM 22778 / Grapes) TaxID=158190 RepID=G8QWU7_SPHPG|nr:lactate racemase domain-containing protein [Sphaerochaeta pleomorpha]AEV28391.1 Uncharacterized conserved protein (DUF2088) [Sphaerochaeta pleomorpha str. Grapes]
MQIVKGGNVSKLLEGVVIPKMFHARQNFFRNHIEVSDIPAAIIKELERKEISSTIKPGMSIAITAGSRGVRNVALITKTIVDFVWGKGAKPFIVPAMGSHGGATAEGQKDMLATFGITEKAMGCPIHSQMETVQLGTSEYGKPVFQDKNAFEADGIIISCRIKPHNAFRGIVESGICKMLVVGLGKQKGAESVHSDGMGNMAKNLVANAKVVLANSRILFAIPCIENAFDETAYIEAVLPQSVMVREPELLQIAFGNMPKILVPESDVLVVNEMGKNYSGTGVDPNISGTWSTEYASGGLKVQRTCFLDLTDVSHGNANGMGLANVITKRMFEKLDTEMIYPNCLTSTVLKSAMMPVVVATDKEAIQACIRTLNSVDNDHIRMVRIKNTLHVDMIMLSEAYYLDVKAGKWPGLEAVSEPKELEFDAEGNLITIMA